jgi:tetratricopeptide (TPR) repeat protein
MKPRQSSGSKRPAGGGAHLPCQALPSGQGRPHGPIVSITLSCTLAAPLWLCPVPTSRAAAPVGADLPDELGLYSPELRATAAADLPISQLGAAAWSLHSPALFSPRSPIAAPWPEAANAYAEGRFLEAFIALDQVPPAQRTSAYWVYRTHLALAYGNAQETDASFAEARRIAPGTADVLALQAIMDLNRGDIAAAQADAERAVAAGPGSSAALLARSYAYQANRLTERALADARRMAEVDPHNPLAQVRIAELELARGDLTSAQWAAERAGTCDPRVAEVQVVRGLVHLALRDGQAAAAAFASAAQLNAGNATAYLGLGLARIRQGRIKAGRQAIEQAAELAPHSALVHAYLGRALLLEGKTDAAAQEFARAQEADPRDPTPHAFEAQRLLADHQPVSALRELDAALERYENRAVYRAGPLVEADRALTLANRAGIEAQIGLDEQGRRDAAQAVAEDPASAAAHRALGDALATLPRAGVARDSEYLQSALRAPLGALPTWMPISDGLEQGAVAPQRGTFRVQLPAATGLNEYAAAFQPNAVQADMDATLADHHTLGDQIRVAGSTEALGWSLSQLSFLTDGIGPHAALHNRALRAAVAAQPSLTTRIYLEHLESRSDRDGVLLPFEALGIATAQRMTEERSQNRLALRQRLGSRDEVLLLLAEGHVGQTLDQLDWGITNTQTVGIQTWETQYLHRGDTLDVILGGIQEETDQRYAFVDVPLLIPFRFRSLYGYAHWRPRRDLTLDLGVAAERMDERSIDLSKPYTQPKLGLRWAPWPGTALRLAWIRTVERFVFSDTTLEPTQVAGHTQFFPDFPGTQANIYAVGWDQDLGGGLAWGLSTAYRDLDSPGQDESGLQWSAQTEHDLRAHLDYALDRERLRPWLPGWEATLSVTLDAQSYHRPIDYTGYETITRYDPRHVHLGAVLRHASGWGLDLALTRVDAQGTHDSITRQAFGVAPSEFSDHFWSLDLAVHYPLPRALGHLTLGGMNLLDEGNSYLDMDPSQPRFARKRYLYAEIRLSY